MYQFHNKTSQKNVQQQKWSSQQQFRKSPLIPPDDRGESVDVAFYQKRTLTFFLATLDSVRWRCGIKKVSSFLARLREKELIHAHFQ